MGVVQGKSFEVGKTVVYQGKEMVISNKGKDRFDGDIKLKELQQDLSFDVDVACAALPAEAKDALRVVRKRVAQDRLPPGGAVVGAVVAPLVPGVLQGSSNLHWEASAASRFSALEVGPVLGERGQAWS